MEYDFISILNSAEKADKYNGWKYSCYEKHVGKKVLEIGCGTGNFTAFYIDNVEEAYATDISQELLEFVRKRFPNQKHLNLLKLDILNHYSEIEKLKQLNFDTILCIDVLEHIENDYQAIVNMKSILPVGGKIIILVPALSKLYSYMDKNIGHFRRYDKGVLKNMADKAGLKIVESRYFNFWGIPLTYIKGKSKKGALKGDVHASLVTDESSKLINLATVILKPIEALIKPPVGFSEIVILQKV